MGSVWWISLIAYSAEANCLAQSLNRNHGSVKKICSTTPFIFFALPYAAPQRRGGWSKCPLLLSLYILIHNPQRVIPRWRYWTLIHVVTARFLWINQWNYLHPCFLDASHRHQQFLSGLSDNSCYRNTLMSAHVQAYDSSVWYLLGFQKTLALVSKHAIIKWVWLPVPVDPKVCTAINTGLIPARFDTELSVFRNRSKYIWILLWVCFQCFRPESNVRLLRWRHPTETQQGKGGSSNQMLRWEQQEPQWKHLDSSLLVSFSQTPSWGGWLFAISVLELCSLLEQWG